MLRKNPFLLKLPNAKSLINQICTTTKIVTLPTPTTSKRIKLHPNQWIKSIGKRTEPVALDNLLTEELNSVPQKIG